MPYLTQKYILEDAEMASSLLPQHVALFAPDGTPIGQAEHPGKNPTVAGLAKALVDAGLMKPLAADAAEQTDELPEEPVAAEEQEEG